MTLEPDWISVNQELIAKTIGELSYEQVLRPRQVEGGDKELYESFVIDLKSGITYSFLAWMSIWDHLRVVPNSISRHEGQNIAVAVSAGQFFIDSQLDTQMNNIILGNFLEEMNNTLYSDLVLLKKQRLHPVEEISTWSGEKIQSILGGHPKILLNKGRMGWGCQDLESYSPEGDSIFRLHWIAVRKNRALWSLREDLGVSDLLSENMDKAELERFHLLLESFQLRFDEYLYLPVHPWQWDQVIKIQFCSELATGEVVLLGVFGDFYRPQISIRTLSNVTRPGRSDIKVSLSILNTSAIRGIPAKYIPIAPQLAKSVSKICREDYLLARAHTEVLADQAGISYQHPLFNQVIGAPYRYHEQLAAIWRESIPSKIEKNETAILTGSLFYKDRSGKSLIGMFMSRSGLDATQWLKLYFRVIVIPLYHLQRKYGIGLVAHGQNIVLRLRNDQPYGMFLKDFQGDLRLSKEDLLPKKKYLGDLVKYLDHLPSNYLIHDLITGHFVTVLRFISGVLQECDGFPEIKFYQILAETIQEYFLGQDSSIESNPHLNLLQETLQRVVVNKVRFRIGYGDSEVRPVPMLAESLVNPLEIAKKNKVTYG